MPDQKSKKMKDEIMKKKALARWESEGGAPVYEEALPLMKTLPSNMAAYKKTPVFTAETVPPALLHNHQTKAGTWGLIQVVHGSLRYTIEGKEIHVLTPGCNGVVEPEVTHFVTPLGDVAFFVEFYRDTDSKPTHGLKNSSL